MSNNIQSNSRSSGQQQQSYNRQQQPQQQQGGILYDISSFDPLQAHALQLTASAGLSAGLLQQQQQQQHQANSKNTTGGVNPSCPPQHGITETNNNNNSTPMLPASAGNYNNSMTSITQLQQQYQQPQHQLNGQQYLFIQPQQQLQHPPSVTVGSVLPRPQVSAAQGNMTGTNNPTILLPAGSTNGQNVPTNTNSGSSHHAVLAASLVGGFPHQFQFPHGLLPQQYLDIAAAAAVASGAGMAVAAPNQGPSPFQHLPPPPPQAQQHQQQSAAPLMAPPGVPCTVSGNNKRGLQETAVSTVGPNKKLRETAPSIVSSSTNGTALKGPIAPPPPSSADLEPPKELSEEDLAKLTPAERRRYERNLREQQRSYRISQQIKELRDVLSESNVPFKPNKYSILLSVVEYIKQLQSRAIMLDSEHQKLITTIRQTNETVNLGNAPTSTDESETINAASTSESGSESELVFVKGIDYRSVFEQCPAALGIAALDGRILECNTEFQTLLGYSRREELLKQSLFNLVRNHQDIFRAMAQMLKTAEDPQPPEPLAAATSSPAPNNDYIIADANPGNPSKENAISNDRFWTGPVTSKLDSKLLMNITLTLGENCAPKFFSCSLTNSIL